jgi:isoaspartyl peptidase/L-asparaginase-like protein (Ntn-hydrolase superfamily)
MEETWHVMLVGDGARAFATKCGLETTPVDTHDKLACDWWKKWQRPSESRIHEPVSSDASDSSRNHDTVTLLVVGSDGTISGGCSTSGLADKFPGRVGDSPILGSGLYVDNEVGAAGGTGIGENIMRYCGSLLIVEAMRAGASPRDACEQVLCRIIKSEASDKPLDIYFVALDRQGRFGAAGTAEFPHAVAYRGYSEVLTSPPVAT